MKRQQLHFFVEVARRGSFKEAGKQLSQSHLTIGLEVHALEKEFGCLLFMRLSPQHLNYAFGQTVQLTSAGETFLPYAERVLQEPDNVLAMNIAIEGRTAIQA